LTRRLWLLNTSLVLLIAAGVWQIRQSWLIARARERAVLQHTTPQPAPPPVLIPQPDPPATGAQYVEVANAVLLARDRNPEVVIDVVVPKPPPPFPRFYGAMDLGDGLAVVLAEKSGGRQRSYRLGEKIGDFTLVSVSRSNIVFEWEGKELSAKVSDMIDRAPAAEAAAAPAPAQAPPAAAPPKAAPTTVLGGSPTKPGADIGTDIKGCQAGDTSPAGSVQDGYKKVVTLTPFGNSCRWELVK
jgi:hypothetical protein